MSTRVLVVDDSRTMRTIIVDALNALGVRETVEAPNGNSAMRCFDEERFDLVITDWRMPGMTGLQLLAAIRAKDAKVPVMMVTSEQEKRSMDQAAAAGVSDYLVKPFRREALQEKLKPYCRR